MSGFTTSYMVDGKEVKPDTPEAIEFVVSRLDEAWNTTENIMGLVPDRFKDEFKKARSDLMTVASRMRAVANDARHVEGTSEDPMAWAWNEHDFREQGGAKRRRR